MSNETDVDYDKVVCQVTDQWRVVLCKAEIQWILQQRSKKHVEAPVKGCYYAKSFVRTRDGVINALKRNNLPIPQEILNLQRIIL